MKRQKNCYIFEEKFEDRYLSDKKYRKIRDHYHCTGVYRSSAHSICVLKYSTPKKITVICHNGSNYDYSFIIRNAAEEFVGKFLFLGENAEKHISFSVPIEKEVKRTYKNG